MRSIQDSETISNLALTLVLLIWHRLNQLQSWTFWLRLIYRFYGREITFRPTALLWRVIFRRSNKSTSASDVLLRLTSLRWRFNWFFTSTLADVVPFHRFNLTGWRPFCVLILFSTFTSKKAFHQYVLAHFSSLWSCSYKMYQVGN